MIYRNVYGKKKSGAFVLHRLLFMYVCVVEKCQQKIRHFYFEQFAIYLSDGYFSFSGNTNELSIFFGRLNCICNVIHIFDFEAYTLIG